MLYELLQVGIINIFAKVLKFTFEIGTSFFLSKSEYGLFSIIISYILIFSKISSLGIQNIIMRDVQKSANILYVSFSLWNSVIITLSISLILLIISVIKTSIISNFAIEIFSISTLLSLIILYSTYLRSVQLVKTWIFFQDILSYLSYFVILLILFMIHYSVNINLILQSYAIALFISYSLLILYLKISYNISFFLKVSISKIKYLIENSLPVLFTGLTYLIISRIDVLMLEKYVDLELVGEYNIVARISLQVLFVNQVIISYYYPKLANKLINKIDFKKISVFNTKFVLLSFMSVLVLTTILFLFIVYFNMFDLLGIEHYNDFFWVFTILSVTQLIYSAIFFYGNILIYIKKQKIEYINNAIVLILAILLNIVFIPMYGVIGASIATAISLLFGNLLQMIEVKFYTGTLFVNFRNQK